MKRTALLLEKVTKLQPPNLGLFVAGAVLLLLPTSGNASNHCGTSPGSALGKTTSCIQFSANPAGVGQNVTITGTTTHADTINGAVTIGQAVGGGKLRIERAMSGLNGTGQHTTCANQVSFAIITEENPTDGTLTTNVSHATTGFFGYRVQYLGNSYKINNPNPPPPQIEVKNSISTCLDLEIVQANPAMPVNKLVEGKPAVCDNATTGDQSARPGGDGTGNNIGDRPCTYSTDNTSPATKLATVFLTLPNNSDPRFNINVYTTTGSGTPGVTINPVPALNGLPFPQPGVLIPPQFSLPGGVPIGFAFTMCEAPDLTTLPFPYTLTSVTIRTTFAAALPMLTAAQYGTLEFIAPSTIRRTLGSWITDGYNVSGRTVVISGAANAANNGTFSISSATATDLTILETTLVSEAASTTETVSGPNPSVTNMPIYFYQTHACFNTSSKFPNGVPVGAQIFAIDLNNAVVCTYTQGGYGNDLGNGVPTGLLLANFTPVYGVNGVQIGELLANRMVNATGAHAVPRGARFTSGTAVTAYLPPQGGQPGTGPDDGVLDQDYLNPLAETGPRPVGFAPQVLTLQLNVDFGNYGVFGGIGNYQVFTGPGVCENGNTVSGILADANKALSGQVPLPANCSVADLQALADRLNNSYDNCVASPDAALLFTKP